MMRPWINLLPLFIVKRIARRRCEVSMIGGVGYHQATDGVLVRTTSTADGEGAA